MKIKGSIRSSIAANIYRSIKYRLPVEYIHSGLGIYLDYSEFDLSACKLDHSHKTIDIFVALVIISINITIILDSRKQQKKR